MHEATLLVFPTGNICKCWSGREDAVYEMPPIVSAGGDAVFVAPGNSAAASSGELECHAGAGLLHRGATWPDGAL